MERQRNGNCVVGSRAKMRTKEGGKLKAALSLGWNAAKRNADEALLTYYQQTDAMGHYLSCAFELSQLLFIATDI